MPRQSRLVVRTGARIITNIYEFPRQPIPSKASSQPLTSPETPPSQDSQLRLGLSQLLDIGELVVEVQALGVEQGAAGLDDLARDDLFDGQLDLLKVDGGLGTNEKREISQQRSRLRLGCEAGRGSGSSPTYRYLGRLEDILGDVALCELAGDSGPELGDQGGVEAVAGAHEQEEHDALVGVAAGPPLPHHHGVRDAVREVPLHHRVYLRRPEPHPARVQHSVRSPQERDPLRRRVHHAEVTMRPLQAGLASCFV